VQLCAVDVRINCWARTSAGEAGLVTMAWSRWRAAESSAEDPHQVRLCGRHQWCQIAPDRWWRVGLEACSACFGNLDLFKAAGDDPPGHLLAHGQYQRTAKSFLQSLHLAWPAGRFPRALRQ